ncbi:phytanoyl-CoA dioxygenase family protein [Penicillium brasilianum]|uniref:Phytanoyl-CoA dioxygenase family protein n=1 Tax=Penicillium brasilianum TaxID=104259 RepID=A0A1S9RAE6_PENBI|nr:phytanoyl-CoA dioxygenase family protein [Penicillium brasilianum]
MPSESFIESFSRDWEQCFDRKPISSNPVIADLDVEHNELAQTWKTFVRYLPPSTRVERGDRPPSVSDVVALVRNTQSLWRSQPRHRVFDQVVALCDRFVPTLETHATLLAVLPDANLFHAPLFYSVLQTLIKASAPYPHVIEGLITALLNIHSALILPSQPISSSTHLMPVAKIYTLCFFFLTEFMDWFIRRSTCELLKSHSQDAYSEFHHLISCIQRQARALTDSSDAMDVDMDEKSDAAYSPRALWEESQLSKVGRQGTDRRIAAQNTITRRLIWEIQQDAEERARIRRQRDQLLTDMLRAVNNQLRPVNGQTNGVVCMTTAAPDLVTSVFEWSRVSKRRLARLELQSASKHLEGFFEHDDQIFDLDPNAQIAIDTSVVTTLQTWVTSPRSQALAVGGSPSNVPPSPVALISACYASFSRRARLPVIAHFCTRPDNDVKGLTLYQQGLIALTYSLIRQLIDCLPTVVDSDSLLDLSAERFRQLDGTISSWKAALALVDTLLHFVPPLLVCVIDGIDTIHDASTDAALRELIRVLLTHTRHQPQPANSECASPTFLFKVLFTVTGRPSALVETMSENQLILTEPTHEPTPSDTVLTSDLGVVMMNA